jgi:hypothetical protein
MSNYKRKKENRQTLNKGGRTVGEDLLFRSRERHFKKVRRLNSGKENPKPSKS